MHMDALQASNYTSDMFVSHTTTLLFLSAKKKKKKENIHFGEKGGALSIGSLKGEIGL